MPTNCISILSSFNQPPELQLLKENTVWSTLYMFSSVSSSARLPELFFITRQTIHHTQVLQEQLPPLPDFRKQKKNGPFRHLISTCYRFQMSAVFTQRPVYDVLEKSKPISQGFVVQVSLRSSLNLILPDNLPERL